MRSLQTELKHLKMLINSTYSTGTRDGYFDDVYDRINDRIKAVKYTIYKIQKRKSKINKLYGR